MTDQEPNAEVVEQEPADLNAAGEAQPGPDLYDMTVETMVRDLMSVTFDELKAAKDAWQKLGENDQDVVIDRVARRVREAVRTAVNVIAAEGFVQVPATLESVTVKDGIKAQLTLSKSDANRHELIDATGSLVMVVLSNAGQYTEAPHQHQHDDKQLSLGLAPAEGEQLQDGEQPEGEDAGTTDPGDPLYVDAVAIVTDTRRGTVSSIQRALQIGFNRAAKLLERMEADGVVSAPDTSGTREVLVQKPGGAA